MNRSDLYRSDLYRSDLDRSHLHRSYLHRSYLYVPGHRPDRFGKAAASGADAVIADLEDAVAPRDKDEARAAVAAWLASPPPVAVWVRVNNHPDLLDADLAMVARSAAAGVVMPKADPEACEASPVAVQALIETAAGIRALDRITAQPRVVRLALGEADLCAELSVTPSADGRELWAIRSDVVVASAAAGLEPPVGPVPTDLDDEEALARTSRQLYGQGFGGRSVLHPRQVATVNEAFTPGPEEIQRARSVVAAHAAADGGPAVLDGTFVDGATVRLARRTLERARLDPPDAPR